MITIHLNTETCRILIRTCLFNAKWVSNVCQWHPFLSDTYFCLQNARTMGSLIHLLKSSLGTGILAMPMAFKNSGSLFGIVGTIIVGLICTHCVQIFVSTHQQRYISSVHKKIINKIWDYYKCNFSGLFQRCKHHAMYVKKWKFRLLDMPKQPKKSLKTVHPVRESMRRSHGKQSQSE